MKKIKRLDICVIDPNQAEKENFFMKATLGETKNKFFNFMFDQSEELT